MTACLVTFLALCGHWKNWARAFPGTTEAKNLRVGLHFKFNLKGKGVRFIMAPKHATSVNNIYPNLT